MKLDRPTPGAPADATQGAPHNQSVLKAIALIGCFVESGDGKTLSELARRTGVNVSTAYRILRTLTATGVLYRHPGEERYVAGPLLLALAGATQGSAGFGRLMDVLRDLAGETGASTSLGVRDGACLVVVFAAPAPGGNRFEHRPGKRINIQCSAMGKAVLAFGAQDDLPARVAGLGVLRPETPHSLTDPAALAEELIAVRRRGYAIARSEHTIGVTSLAVAVSGPVQRATAAVGLQMPTAVWRAEDLPRLVAALSRAADRLAALEELSRIPAD